MGEFRQLPDGSHVMQVQIMSGVVTAATVSPKMVLYPEFSAALAANAATTPVARDISSTPLYSIYRVRVVSPVAGTLEILHGANATITGNKVVHSQAITAGTPYVVDIPLAARFVGCKFTNGATAVTAGQLEITSALIAF